MDHRGQAWPDSGRHSRRAKDKDDYYRYSQQDRGQGYLPPDPRERDRHWGHPGAQYGGHLTSPPPRPEPYPYSPHQYQYGYGQPDHQRPQSRHGYDFPAHSQWDYRDSYGYYNHDYYNQRGPQDPGQWGPQESWSSDWYHEGPAKDQSGSSYRYDQGRESSQTYLNGRKDPPSRENEEVSSYYLGTLEGSKHSGLSSSSYELSQYINGAEPVHTNDAVHQTPAPLKYSIPHAVASFGPAGQLIRVTPGFSAQESTSKLEIHSLEVILSETQEQQEMRKFPGPLAREDLHKADAMEFAYQMTGACMRDDKLQDKSSAALLWSLLTLLCRQNAQIVGSDIAELLMQGSRSEASWESEARALIDFGEGPPPAEAPPRAGDDLLTGNWGSFSSESPEKALQSYTQLLLAGRKKEALESAMSNGLWGHALFLASKMDNRSYTTVLNRFTGELTASDPLQTLFQLLSGRIPAVATGCGNDKWGDWRPHLAVMLSNETGDAAVQQKAIVTMGDTLASRGLVHAAHVCYLTAGVPFGVFANKADRLVLVGSSHRRPFRRFAALGAIQCTELYEYCQTLGGKSFAIASFQVYKLIYASRLLDCGLASQAFHYCEVVGQAILRQREPFFLLTGEVIKLADRLRFSEGQFGDAGVSEAQEEPGWLRLLRARHSSVQMENYDCTDSHLSARGQSNVCSGSDLQDLTRDIQSPEPELLYYRDTEDDQNLLDQTEGSAEETTASTQGIGGSQDCSSRPFANPPVPVPGTYAPPAATVTASQGFSYHNTDSAEVRGVSPHCPPANLPSAAEGPGPSPEALMMGGQLLEVDISHQGQQHQSIPKVSESPEQTTEPPKQSAKAGWFSGWFRSKPKDVKKDSSEPGGPAHTEAPPVPGFCAPPPPAPVHPGTSPFQPPSPGINPFSRKAAMTPCAGEDGRELGKTSAGNTASMSYMSTP